MRNILTRWLVIAIFLPISANAQWTGKADGLKFRSEVNSVVYQGKLYAFMGFRDSLLNVEPTSEVYDPATGKWTLLSSIPAGKEITHQGCVLIDDNVWHIGGRVGQHPGPLTNEIWIYNITKDTWSQGPSLVDPATGEAIRWGAGGAALVGRTLHIFGGFTINACDNDQDKYHLTLDVDEWLSDTTKPAHWKNDLAPMPVKRNHFATVVLGGKIYALGGQFGHDCGGGLDMAYCHAYDPQTNTWTELTPRPAPRSHIEGSTFAMDGKIYLMAGQGTNGGNSNLVSIFDPMANDGLGSWQAVDSLTLPSRYEGLSAKPIGNTLYFDHGGEGSSRFIRKELFAHAIERHPVLEFGFPAGCSTFTVQKGDVEEGKTLLFTIDGTKSYTISSDADWLRVTKNAEGVANANGVDINFELQTAGLQPGTYTATLTATGQPDRDNYKKASHCITLTVESDESALTRDTLEAELATLQGTLKKSSHPGFTGTGYADFIDSTDSYVEWYIENAAGGNVALQIRYANGSKADRPVILEVNGTRIGDTLRFEPTGSWDTWSIQSSAAVFQPGKNTVRIKATGVSGGNIDHLIWHDLPAVTNGILEAEDAVYQGPQKATNHTGYTGTGFVDFLNPSAGYIEWDLVKGNEGPANLAFRYSNGKDYDRPLTLEVNGQIISTQLSFPSTGSWEDWGLSSVRATLHAGHNKIRLTAIAVSGANIDHLEWQDAPLEMTEPNSAIKFESPAENFKSFKAKIFPNPVQGATRLSWQGGNLSPVKVKLLDITGKTYKEFTLPGQVSGTTLLPLSGLAPGNYLLILQNKNELTTLPFIIK